MITTHQEKPVNRLPRSGPKTLQESFKTFIPNTFERKARFDLYPAKEIPDLSAHYERHLYFVTFHVRPNNYSARDGVSSYNAQPIFAAFKSWYLTVCEELLGPKFNKKPMQQPFTMAFLDVEGSRYGKAAKAFDIPHIHALMLTHPKVMDKFRALVKSNILTLSKDPRIGKIDIEPFVDDGRGPEPLLTYAAKYPRLEISKARHEMTLWTYPDLTPDKFRFLQVSRHTNLLRQSPLLDV